MSKVTMSKKNFIKEHVKLVNILENGSQTNLRKEAESQQKELNKIMYNNMKKEKDEKGHGKLHEKKESKKIEREEHESPKHEAKEKKMEKMSKKFYK